MIQGAQCTAHRRRPKGSTAELVRCRNCAVAGTTVCRYHGGSSPQALRKAKERLAALECPAVDVLEYAIKRHKAKGGLRDAMVAARDVLDRTGHKPKEQVEISGNLAERLVAARKRVEPPAE